MKVSKKSVPSWKQKEESKILELLTEMKQKLDKSVETLSDVCKRVRDLESGNGLDQNC